MWMMLFQRYWSQGVLLLLLSVLSFYLMLTKIELSNTINERNQYKQALDFQNATLLKEAEEHERKLKELPKEIEKITTRYKVIYESIDTWEGDNNASDCDNADAFLRSFNY